MSAIQPDVVPDEGASPDEELPELTREAILSADDLPREKVQVPEWGGAVWVRTLTAAERDRFEDDLIDRSGKRSRVSGRDIRAKLAVLAICDASGNRLFSDPDATGLTKKSSAAMDRVYNVARRLSGVSEEDIEEIAKNSGKARAA